MYTRFLTDGWSIGREFSRSIQRSNFYDNPPKNSSGSKKNKSMLRWPVILPDLIKLQVFHLFKASCPGVHYYEAYRFIFCFINALAAFSATGDLNKN
jgi:hypothetical protein